MFGDLLNIKVKAAEKALRDGRWDEAYRLAGSPDLRISPRAVAVLTALAPTLLARARDHFRAERINEALADLDRAELAGGGGGPLAAELTELRGHIQAVAAEFQRREQARRATLDEARRRLEAGSLVGGQQVLAEAGSDAEAARLRGQIARRGEDAARAAREAREMMTADQWGLAAERIRRAKSLDPHEAAVVGAEAAVSRTVLERARAALREGRISRALDELSCIDGLAEDQPEKRELARLVHLAGDAATCVSAERYTEARRLVAILANALTGAAWLQDVLVQLRNVEELRGALRGGPLGFSIEAKGAGNGGVRRRPVIRVSDGPTVSPQRASGVDGLPDRLLLIVDGGGSYLLLRSAMAGIGRAACDHPAEVALLSDISERHATISRMEEDYFLMAAREVEVAGKMTSHRLLRDGDRLVLGKKAKMTFHLPSRCSASAVLALSDTTKMPQDVRRVVLLSGHAIIGNGPSAHILCRHASQPLVLFERDGQLRVRSRNDGHVDTQSQLLRLGEATEAGGVRLVLNAWPARKLAIGD